MKWKNYFKKEKLLLKPKFIIIFTLSLASILILSAIIELFEIKKEILLIMSDEATSLIESIAVSSENATLAYGEIEDQIAERLLNNARLVEILEQKGQLTHKILANLANENNLFRINLFDKSGEKILSSHEAEHTNLPPLLSDGVTYGLYRIGLKTNHIEEANARTKRRLALISVLLLVGDVFVFNFIIINQNYSLLDEAYLRTKTYTGNILANMADAAVAIDKEDKITLFNRAAETLFNLTEKQVIGKKCSQLIQNESVLEKTLRAGKGVKDFETNYKIREKPVILSFNTFVLKNKLGEVDSAVAVIKDLTERWLMEENLHRKEKLTALGELASGVAHEVRNPLNAIGMIAQRLNKDLYLSQQSRNQTGLTKLNFFHLLFFIRN